ncbi:MAG: metal ABC transporter ATP-binding protein [bacterium]|nr:metal ABC transporter ATP-binding protein [bacterium]
MKAPTNSSVPHRVEVAPGYVACGECCTRVEGLSVRLQGRTILENVNLHLHCGELLTIIGPNGAGKTTLLRALIGEVPHTGTLAFYAVRAGHSVGKAVIGYVPQSLDIDRGSPITVTELFAAVVARRPLFLGVSQHVCALARRHLALVEAEHLADCRLGLLSGGELHRVMLAFALTPMPDILLLDEPLASVDHAGVVAFYRTVASLRAQRHMAVIMVSHNLSEAAHISTRMAFLYRTIVCEGTPREVLAHPIVRSTFGVIAPPAD